MNSYFETSTTSVANDENDDENTFRILMATDIHLGYAEKDPERENDSFLAFEECLQYAVSEQVDFILLGGDLYHENKPSRATQFRCIELLRKYCLGETPAAFEFLSSRETTLSHGDSYKNLNYEDPNINVAIPVFSIHGNHDDPSGHGGLCALDLLAAAGLVNFFGKTKAIDSVESIPLLMRKGATLLAIYGIGAMRDERLHRMFLQKRVTFLRPKEHADDFFNLLCIHQNRSKHGAKNFIPESFLDDFLDFILWGHEHESFPSGSPYDKNSARGFYVTQPGSTVATSLADGESAPKHCVLLKVRGTQFSLTPLPLKTCRQLYVENLTLSKTEIQSDDPRCLEKIEKKCVEIVRKVLKNAEKERSGDDRQPKKPLIRLKVDASPNYPVLFPGRFGHLFMDHVANPKEILLFHKKRLVPNQSDSEVGDDEGLEGFESLNIQANLNAHRLEDIISEMMEAPDNKMGQLRVLSDLGLRRALEAFVDKEDKDAIGNLMNHQIDKLVKYAKNSEMSTDINFDDEDDVGRFVSRFHNERNAKSNDDEESEVLALLQQARTTRKVCNDFDEEFDEDDDEGEARVKPKIVNRKVADDDFDPFADDDDNNSGIFGTSQGTGKRGTGKRGGRGSRGGRTTKTAAPSSDDIAPAPAKRGRGRGRGASATTSRAKKKVEPMEEDDIFDVVDDDDASNDMAMPPPVAPIFSRASQSNRSTRSSYVLPCLYFDLFNLYL